MPLFPYVRVELPFKHEPREIADRYNSRMRLFSLTTDEYDE